MSAAYRFKGSTRCPELKEVLQSGATFVWSHSGEHYECPAKRLWQVRKKGKFWFLWKNYSKLAPLVFLSLMY